MILSKDDILNADDSKLETVNVPEWGGYVCIKALSGIDRQAYTEAINSLESDIDKQSLVLVTTLCNEQGETLFTSEDIEALNKKNSGVLDRLTKEAFNVNGLGAEAVEDAEKN